MPHAPRRPCRAAGCGQLQPCPRHGAASVAASSTERRKDAPYRRLYDSQAWRKASAGFLRGKVCERCDQGTPRRFRLANVTDHRVPHCGDLVLFWDRENWRPLCRGCNNAVRREQGEA